MFWWIIFVVLFNELILWIFGIVFWCYEVDKLFLRDFWNFNFLIWGSYWNNVEVGCNESVKFCLKI